MRAPSMRVSSGHLGAHACADKSHAVRTSICFLLADPEIAARPERERRAFTGAMADCLAAEGLPSISPPHRDAPPGSGFGPGLRSRPQTLRR